MSLPSPAARCAVGLLEVLRVLLANLGHEPPGAVEHQRQGVADTVEGVLAKPHGVAAQAFLIGERAAGVEFPGPPGRRGAGQPGESRLQTGHGRGHPLGVTGRGRQFRPGRRPARPVPFLPVPGRRRR